MKRNINKKIVKNNYKTHIPTTYNENKNLVLLYFRHRPKALKENKAHPIPLDIRSINFRSINHPITLQRPNKLAHPCNSREQVHTLGRWLEQRRPVPRLTKHNRSNILTQPRLQFATKLFAKYFGQASG